MHKGVLVFAIGIVVLSMGGAEAASEVDAVVDIAPVWAGHPVGFCLLTAAPWQFAAYYDAERRMTVAARKLDETEWRYQILPEQVGWDSHNYITMALDDEQRLHLSGNMHCHPLVYFRTEQPLDIRSFKRVPAMTGELEAKMTYPRFFRGPQQEFIFTYRDGKSGSGNQVYNVYDGAAQRWRRLLDQPLTDGEGQRNAYLSGPAAGPDGYWHLCWVWRETPDCATNNNPSYARSKDLVQWENSRGEALSLPITRAAGDIVDPVPVGGGIINGNVRLSFDRQQRPVVSYHKYDEKGKTQIYNARAEGGAWKIYQSTQWAYRWDFSGGGTIHFEVSLQGLKPYGEVDYEQTWTHSQYGKQRWRLDGETLAPVEQLPLPESSSPKGWAALASGFPGMQVKSAGDSGKAEAPGIRYCLRWETLGPNRDHPREKPWPEASMLRLYRLKQ